MDDKYTVGKGFIHFEGRFTDAEARRLAEEIRVAVHEGQDHPFVKRLEGPKSGSFVLTHFDSAAHNAKLWDALLALVEGEWEVEGNVWRCNMSS